ncbi:beta-aspartyl-peptidase (threonine type) [Plasticicumulans lactativorans]|uniref:Isoaspartyl peptidase n=1 Tax=Plasticicumulans lactativorans TaxID=1133106 RepID=A0A4V2SCW9_9GAMM|nr:isoaspartyl peptidase/L-asparaginase [Plasticicumulans lactativorans]TCO81060.1 beta-aspartyl-peptidase (threonine type) [Plasticicumulans lactativorans]
MQTFALAIHGGAGTVPAASLTPEAAAAYRRGLEDALRAGHAVLCGGGSALDAVTAAVCALEDDPLFNAGRGAVFNLAGRHEMDAAVMDGRDRAAGAVAALCDIRNPVRVARRVMEASPHVLLAGEGARAFALEQGFAAEPEAYFHTERRWQALQEERARLHDGGSAADAPAERRHGTVGAVARDVHGHLAAATSTGGMTAKHVGRVGDTPLIGAGTFADDASCAVSATGHGEFFIRRVVAHSVHARISLLGEPLARAAEVVVMDELRALGGEGGLVAVDRHGHIAMPFNSEGMYRGCVRDDGRCLTAIHGEAPALR